MNWRHAFVVWIGFVWLSLSPLCGHYLNMTRATLTVDPLSNEATLDVKIDFTRLVGSPEAYYALTRLPPEETIDARSDLLDRLVSGLRFRTAGVRIEPFTVRVEHFEFPDLPLEKFTEPWAAPMATVSCVLSFSTEFEELSLSVSPLSPIEFPFVLTLQQSGAAGQTVTRWLEPGQSSPKFFLMELYGGSVSQPLESSGPEQVESRAADTLNDDGLFDIVLRYIGLGFTHILPKGFDHILFICGLFFLTNRWRDLLFQASLFTLAHTLTLGLTASALISYRPEIVEPLIALSIAYVGIENMFLRKLKRSRLLVVFGFGLIHGMGFAGMLGEIGLPKGDFFSALFAFNLGVELGQIAILAAFWLLLCRLFSWRWYRCSIQLPCSIVISLIALFWFFERVDVI